MKGCSEALKGELREAVPLRAGRARGLSVGRKQPDRPQDSLRGPQNQTRSCSQKLNPLLGLKRGVHTLCLLALTEPLWLCRWPLWAGPRSPLFSRLPSPPPPLPKGSRQARSFTD